MGILWKMWQHVSSEMIKHMDGEPITKGVIPHPTLKVLESNPDVLSILHCKKRSAEGLHSNRLSLDFSEPDWTDMLLCVVSSGLAVNEYSPTASPPQTSH